MTESPIPFQLISWENVQKESQDGESGYVESKVLEWKGLRIRIVKYSRGYIADHCCSKGHIVHCLQGTFVSEMEDGSEFILHEGMSYIVSNGMSSHRSKSADGVKLLIIDGDFLNLQP